MLQRGLAAEGFDFADRRVKSKNFGVILAKQSKPMGGFERRNSPKT
jgi:hypothetical protein